MLNAINVKTEYLVNPMGIDIAHPRLFWQCEGKGLQTGYEIEYLYNGQRKEIQTGTGNLMHAQCELILKSRDCVNWRVRILDEERQYGNWSEWASFEMGLLDEKDWKASWIMGNYNHDKKKDVRYSVDCFRKHFSMTASVKKARLYATACGLYEVTINGKKVGERVLAPGSTAFQKRVHYQTYDVTEYLKEQNELEVELADGFYASKTGCFNKTKVFGNEPKVLLQLEITDKSGSAQIICSNDSFSWSNDGMIRYADMKDGEDIDFDFEPSYARKAKLTSYEGKICADNNVAVKEMEHFVNPKIISCPDGHTVLDFGQNIAGYVQVNVPAAKGKSCQIVLGEKLNDEGNFTTKNISLKGDYFEERIQTIKFMCNESEHVYKTKFAVMGFQYALVLDWPVEIKAEDFTAIAVYSDMNVTMDFDSSDEGINSIVKNTMWSVKGNFLDVPTDCPTRERAGWTGDAQLFFKTGNYMMDQRSFFRKWMLDIADCQKENGKVYNINPANPSSPAIIEWLSVEGGVGWGDAYIMIPYYFWKRYGDDTLIKEHWEGMKRCFAFYEKRVGKRNYFTRKVPKLGEHAKYLCACGRDFGEWTEPADCAPEQKELLYPHPEEGTAYIAYDSSLMAEMAKHLGEDSESTRLYELSRHLKEAYIAYFLTNDEKQNRLCKYVRPCGLHIVEGELRERILKKIVELNRERNYQIGTGFLSTPFVMELLTEAGVPEDAYKTLTNPEFGWMQQIKNGATTVWENWTNDASLNHYSKGACCQWLFDCVCGIQLDERENHFVVTPHVIPQIQNISLGYESVYGTVRSGWEQKDGMIIYKIEVPGNCMATIQLPGQEKQEVQAGKYEWTV